MSRRLLPSLVLLAVLLHLAAMSRSILPAQDGLKFLRVARQFQVAPWDVVVLNSDQHPLYPALVAGFEPVVASLMRPGPACWRVSAQMVSMLASVLTLWPLHRLARRLFDESVATLSVFLWVLLPLPAEIGHDTLADPLALLATVVALMCAERAFVDRSLRSAIACGVVSGIGFLARPEVALVPVALSAAFGWRWIRETIAPLRNSTWESRRGGNVSLLSGKELRSSRQGAHAPRSPGLRHRPAWAPGHVSLAGAWIGLGLIVGYYALIKGEVSEKLAVRHSASVSTPSVAIPSRGHVLMPGMNAGEWDFSAKEESGNPSRLPPGRALGLFLCSWAESLGWIGAVLAILGAVRVRSGPGRTLVACYLGLFGVILVRHASMLGYLSGRHVLSLALLCTPWAASGLRAVGLRLSGWMNLELKRARRLRIGFALAAVVFASMIQLRPAHASRWGYQEAGLWISRHAGAGEAVLDTRGWAAFVADQPSYDYWHVRQALTDSRLTYIVVDRDELEARSLRAKSLQNLLDRTSRLVAGFPSRSGGTSPDVLVYRFERPTEWEVRLP